MISSCSPSAFARVCPSLAAACRLHELEFCGSTDACGPVPVALLFNDIRPGSPAFGATIHVPLPCTAEDLGEAIAAKRELFAQAASWGGPAGFDSGFDYARN